MKKLKEAHDTASNGLEAFEKYKKAPGTFKIIFMGNSPSFILHSLLILIPISPTNIQPNRYFHAHNGRPDLRAPYP